MDKEKILLEALNTFGNFTTVSQEFNDNQLEVIYEAMKLVNKNDLLPRVVCNTWLFFYEGEKDKPQFKVQANTQWEAYQVAEETYGPQVEDMMYCII